MDLNISGHTHLITLIGKPTDHSMSPATHSLCFKKQGIDTVYLAFDIENEDIPTVLGAMRAMDGWDGSNVTMPCKQAVIPHLDGLTDAAELIGAVNVIEKKQDRKLIGHNTDGAGFMGNLRKHGFDAAGKTVTLVGPGGAGSAILVQAALDGVEELFVFARKGGPSYTHAEELIPRVIEKTGCKVSLHDLGDKDDLKACLDKSDALFNGTSVGMGEGCTNTPIDTSLIHGGMVVADAVYLPRETQLLKDAAAKGCKVVGGIGMMNEQAGGSETIWYGVEPPIAEVAEELSAQK